MLANEFLDTRQQCVRLGETKSSYAPICVGVPQGTVSGPLFWLASVNSFTPRSQFYKISYTLMTQQSFGEWRRESQKDVKLLHKYVVRTMHKPGAHQMECS